MEKYELYHHGVKGQKWGVRRYQKKDGSLTAAGRKRQRADRDGDSKRGLRMLFKKSNSSSGEKKHEPSEEEILAEKKKKILDTHSAEEVYKNKDLFTDKEIQNAYNRLNTERNIQNLIPEKANKGRDFVKSYSEMSNNVENLVNSTTKLYDSYQKGKKLVNILLKVT